MIWSSSCLFKNGAVPHQFVLGGLDISEEGVREKEQVDESLSVGSDKSGVSIW